MFVRLAELGDAVSQSDGSFLILVIVFHAHTHQYRVEDIGYRLNAEL